jgi:hypothetical protein
MLRLRHEQWQQSQRQSSRAPVRVHEIRVCRAESRRPPGPGPRAGPGRGPSGSCLPIRNPSREHRFLLAVRVSSSATPGTPPGPASSLRRWRRRRRPGLRPVPGSGPCGLAHRHQSTAAAAGCRPPRPPSKSASGGRSGGPATAAAAWRPSAAGRPASHESERENAPPRPSPPRAVARAVKEARPGSPCRAL